MPALKTSGLMPDWNPEMQSQTQIKNQSWITDWDLQQSPVLKPDKTGKALLTILRHLKRIQEVSHCVQF